MILCVVGARPNFVKMAPVIREIRKRDIPHRIVHTGQHTSPEMSDGFMKAIRFPEPDIRLAARNGTQAEQTASIMIAFEGVCRQISPDLVMVAGDVNSTLACALAAAKLNIPVAHVEAGLRSFDKSMPEETNRILTDQLSELLFTTERAAGIQLQREGIAPEKIHFTGNPMIDTLQEWLSEDMPFPSSLCHLKLAPKKYALVTLHRPGNVDVPERLGAIVSALETLALKVPVVFLPHPRTRRQMASGGFSVQHIKIAQPLDYPGFIALASRARIVLTDSGGIQEETSFMGVPCLTLRTNTERPITVQMGTNILLGTEPSREAILEAANKLLNSSASRPRPFIEGWDGKAGERIAHIIQCWHEARKR